MNRTLLFFSAIVLLFTSCVNAQDGLPPAEFEKLIATSQMQLLDVRTAGEFQSGHLKNALQADWLNKDQFTDRTQYLDKTKPIFVYCASGVRSAAAAKYLQEKGFANVQNLKGGLTAWKLEGRAVEGVANKAQLTNKEYAALSKSANLSSQVCFNLSTFDITIFSVSSFGKT